MNKVVTGILAIVPSILFVIYMINLMMVDWNDARPDNMGIVCVLFAAIGILALIDTVLFIVYDCKQTHWSIEKRVAWGIALYSFNIFVFPVFWWLYMRKE